MQIYIYILEKKQFFKKRKKDVGLLMVLKKNENKADVELTLSEKTNNSLKLTNI